MDQGKGGRMAGRDRAELTRLGEALLEALAARDPARLPLAPGARYTEDGQFASGTLADYLLPMAADMPDVSVAHV